MGNFAAANAMELCCCAMGGAREVRSVTATQRLNTTVKTPSEIFTVWQEPVRPPKKTIPDVLHLLAQRVEGTFKKSPMSGKSLVKGMQERYFALRPLQSEEGDAAAGQPQRDLHRWAQGKLCFWKDKGGIRAFPRQAAYRAKEPPKGSIEILKIAKVSWDKKCPSGNRVIVKHMVGNGIFHELVVQFPTKGEAEDWAYSLWDFISQVRSILDDEDS